MNDYWCFELNPVWLEFSGAKLSSAAKVAPFVSDTPVHGWAFMGSKSGAVSLADNADLYVLLQPASKVRLLLDRSQVLVYSCCTYTHAIWSHLQNPFQYAFLIQISDRVSDFMTMLSADQKCFFCTMQPKSLIVSCLCVEVELQLLLQPLHLAKKDDNNEQASSPDSVSLESEDNVAVASESAGNFYTYLHLFYTFSVISTYVYL